MADREGDTTNVGKGDQDEEKKTGNPGDKDGEVIDTNRAESGEPQEDLKVDEEGKNNAEATKEKDVKEEEAKKKEDAKDDTVEKQDSAKEDDKVKDASDEGDGKDKKDPEESKDNTTGDKTDVEAKGVVDDKKEAVDGDHHSGDDVERDQKKKKRDVAKKAGSDSHQRHQSEDRDQYKISYLLQRYNRKLKLFSRRLKGVFNNHADERGNVQLRRSNQVLKDFADALSLTGSQEAFEAFQSHAETFQSAKLASKDYLKGAMDDLLDGGESETGMIDTGDVISYEDFTKTVENWIETFHPTLDIGDVESDLKDSDPVKSMLMDNIDQYESLRIEKERKGEDTSQLDGLLRMLNTQLEEAEREEETINTDKTISHEDDGQKKREKLRKKEATLEARREKGLKEIFIFYARQHYMVGRTATFEDLATNVNKMFLGEFNKFLNDFQLNVENLSKSEVGEVFKKSSQNCKELSLPDFYNCLDNFAVEQYDKYLERKRTGEESGSDEDAEEDGKKKRSVNYYRDMIYQRIHPEKPSVFRAKLSGFSLPFGSDPKTRTKPTNYEYKPPAYLNKEELQKIIGERKKARQDKREEAKLKYSQPRQNGLQNGSIDTRSRGYAHRSSFARSSGKDVPLSYRSRGSSHNPRSNNPSSEKRKRVAKPLNHDRSRLAKGKPEVVTLGDLQNMNNEEKTNDLDLDDLINDSDSDDEDAEVLGQYGIKARTKSGQNIANEDEDAELDEALRSKRSKPEIGESPVIYKRKLHAVQNRSQEPTLGRKGSVGGGDGLGKVRRATPDHKRRRSGSKDSKAMYRKRNEAILRSIESDSVDMKNPSYKVSPKAGPNHYRNISHSMNLGQNQHNNDAAMYQMQNPSHVNAGYYQAFNPNAGGAMSGNMGHGPHPGHYKNSPSVGGGSGIAAGGYSQIHRHHNPAFLSQDYSSSGHPRHGGAGAGGIHASHSGNPLSHSQNYHPGTNKGDITHNIRQRAQQIDQESKQKEELLMKMHNKQMEKGKKFGVNARHRK